jgi:YHS domain-containing protein
MKFSKIIFFCAAGLVLSSCGNLSKKETKSSAPVPKKTIEIAVTSLALKNDPVCEMPIKQGEIGDTATYEGKVYGFCGTGCKDEFVKAPTKYLNQQQ